MAPKYKLTYFNLTALGEPIRMLFHYGGIEFEDNRVDYKTDQWATLKPTTPFGQIPMLEIDSKVVNQSNAICRYLAKIVKLNGSDVFEDLEIDVMVDNINDLRMKIANYWYEADEEYKKKKYEPLVKDILPNLLAKLDAVAKANNGHFVGGKLTWVDIYFVGILTYLNFMLEFDLTDKYPNLAAIRTNVSSVPSIRKYLDSRPATDF